MNQRVQVQEKAPSEQQDPRVCENHAEELILFCLKDQVKICSKCLNSTHLLHPVVPLNSLENLDFSESLSAEIDTALRDIRSRESYIKLNITKSLVKHKIALRNHIIFIRENLK